MLRCRCIVLGFKPSTEINSNHPQRGYLFPSLFSLSSSLKRQLFREERKSKSEKRKKQKTTTFRRKLSFLLAEDEGFEPPQTESESGVLPLHKSSISGTILLYTPFEKSQELFSTFSIFFLPGRIRMPGRNCFIHLRRSFFISRLPIPRISPTPSLRSSEPDRK